MASSESFLMFLLDQLSGLDNVRVRPMMGEYLLYYRDKLMGDICDDRLLVKPVQAALDYVTDPVLEPPYEGAKPMLLVQNLEDRAWLTGLMEVLYEALPEPKPKKRKS